LLNLGLRFQAPRGADPSPWSGAQQSGVGALSVPRGATGVAGAARALASQ
jgi:hypothetical protein